MVPVKNFYFFKDINAQGHYESDVISNTTGETLIIQIFADTDSSLNFVLRILGCVEQDRNNFFVLSCFSSTFNVNEDLHLQGIYTACVEGMCKIKADLHLHDDGTPISVYAKITKGG